jgi:hypothetical protein
MTREVDEKEVCETTLVALLLMFLLLNLLRTISPKYDTATLT